MSELENLTLPELLTHLEDITTPEPLSYIPQTTAWYLLAAVLLLILVAALWRLAARYRVNRYRREALAALMEIERQSATDSHSETQVAAVLRRTALSIYPRASVASLHGRTWLKFLDQSYGGKDFSDGPGRVIANAAYQPTHLLSAHDRAGLLRVAQSWVRKHRAGDRHA